MLALSLVYDKGCKTYELGTYTYLGFKILSSFLSDPLSMNIYNQTVNVSSLKYEEPRAAEVRIETKSDIIVRHT